MNKKSKKSTYKRNWISMMDKIRLRKSSCTNTGESTENCVSTRAEENREDLQNDARNLESSSLISLGRVVSCIAVESYNSLPRESPNLERSDLNLTENTQDTNEEKFGSLSCDTAILNRNFCRRTYLNNTKKKTRKNTNKQCITNPLSIDHSVENGGEERRIVDIQYYTSSLLNHISKHSSYCGPESIEFHSEKMYGLSSKITFRCKMCNSEFKIDTCDPKPEKTLDLNTATVTGMTVTGIGLAQLSELFAAMNLPQMSQNIYDKTHKNLSNKWEETAMLAMEAAAKREREAAIKEGRVKDGIAVIDVIADGCWGKRSYKKNYSSLSGAAAIVGRRFGEVLFLGVRNKYCSICAQSEKKGLQPKEHSCYKNYTGPSTGMESDIIVEGFKHSINMHQIIYGRMIGDGDCNTYSKILEARPYSNVTVEKLECKNHLLRNMCNKLAAAAIEKKYPLAHRKMLTTQRILAIRKAICLAVKENRICSTNEDSTKKLKNLYRDITNTCYHAFGEHKDCKSYYCESEKKSENLVPKLRSTPMWSRVQYVAGVVASNSRSLLYDVNSNRVEGFNSVIAKLVGGKRTNLSSRQTYQTRCNAAVVSFNTKRPVYSLQKSVLGFSPKYKSKLLEERRLRKNILCQRYLRRKLCFSSKHAPSDKHYGESCQKPDMDMEQYTQLRETFLRDMKKTDDERKDIEQSTILQRDSGEWLELRRQLLTASNFGKIVKKRDSTSASLVKAMLYKRDLSNVAAIKHGVENESNALNQLADQLNICIRPCGLFIDPEIPYLGATPDGVIGEDQVVEIKCPISVHKAASVMEVVQKKKLPIYKLIQGKLVINKNHDWYFQIQGQLHITRRKLCVFAIWLGDHKPLHVELIKRDTEFFKTKMLSKLSTFYLEHILPELLDPRHTRNMPLRGISANRKRHGNSSILSSQGQKKRKTTEDNVSCDSTAVNESAQTITKCIDFKNF